MPLEPGTRIPTLTMTISWVDFARERLYGLIEGFALGATLGIAIGACLSALAWSHMGG